METKILWVAVLFLAAATVSADMGDFSEAQDILAESLPSSSLSDSQFESVGDYFMDLMVGNRHERMDAMLGGEGSDSLREFHISLGKENYERYLADGSLDWPEGSMMGGWEGGGFGMMDGWEGGGYGMMGNWSYPMMSGGWWILGIIIILTITALFALFIALMVRGSQRKSDPCAVLDRRFAEGELTEKEYRERKRAIGC